MSNNKLQGQAQTIERIRTSNGMDVSNYVPTDIEDMITSPEYIAVASEVLYDVNKDFSPVDRDGNFMPSTDLMYKIGSARGVNGIPEASKNEAVYDEVDWSRLAENRPDAIPKMVRFKVGYKSTKQSYVLEPDGSTRKSNVWSATWNVWERCCTMWSAKPDKYPTSKARRSHLDTEMKHAEQKSEYKAHSKTIRELAGMPTGYSKADLQKGYMTFHKIQKSPEAVKMDAMARREGMARGSSAPSDATLALFGPESVPESLPLPTMDAPPSFAIEREPWEIMRDTLAEYIGNGFVGEKHQGPIDTLMKYLEENHPGESDSKWQNALDWLFYVEENVPDDKAVNHGFQRTSK